jgi:excisionase family DNA binding protein
VTTPTTYNDDWCTLLEGARYVNFHPATLRREIAAGRLRAARIASRKAIRIRRSWLDEWMERSATPIEVPR